MATLGNNLDCISASPSSLSQGVSIDIEPAKGGSDGVLVLHPEAMLTIIAHVVGQLNDTIPSSVSNT